MILNTVNQKQLDIIKNVLQAGETSVTIESDQITENSVLSFYTSVYGVNPTEVTVETGSVTLSFDAQENDLTVEVRIDG